MSFRLRHFLATLALAWALFWWVLAILPVWFSPEVPYLPVGVTTIAGNTITQSLSDQAREAGIGLGDRVLSVDGMEAHLWYRQERSAVLRLDHPNVYRVEKSNQSIYQIPVYPVAHGVKESLRAVLPEVTTIIVGWIVWFLGAFVWLRKNERPEAWAFVLFCSAMAAQLFGIRPTGMGWSYIRSMMNPALVAAASFHFFTTFPIEPRWARENPATRWIPYIFAGALALLQGIQPLLGLHHVLLSRINFTFTISVSIAAILFFAYERRKSHRGVVGDRADLILVAMLVSFFPTFINLFAQIFFRSSFPLTIPLAWIVFLPIAGAYAILQGHRIFEIRQVFKSSAAYGASSVAIMGLFAGLIYFVYSSMLGGTLQNRSAWIDGLIIVLAILIFNPVRTRLQGFVDRIFDHDRARYREAVRDISDAMVSMLSIREIVERILIALTNTMGAKRATVLLFDEEKKKLVPASSRGDWNGELEGFELLADHPTVRALWMRREEFSIFDFAEESNPLLREASEALYAQLEARLLVPILFGVDLLGVIAVGAKLSGDRFVNDDRQLLRTLANQSAIAIENAMAYADIAQLNENLEQRVEERTQELQETQAQLIQNEKMVSLGQLVAGVAHELNNPIGFVHANLQLIEEKIKLFLNDETDAEKRRKVQEDLSKLIARSREGTGRVKEIVEDLRAFSRLDRAELQEVNLNEYIDRTLSLMKPRLSEGIEVYRDYADLPRVHCYIGQLNQVFMNLLVNACDAAGRSGKIWIRTLQIDDGVRLEFSDNGPGIPEEIQNRIFEPFYTTKNVGQGTGLGLSISHGIIERHGGKIWMESRPGGGACFVIELPLEVARENL